MLTLEHFLAQTLALHLIIKRRKPGPDVLALLHPSSREANLTQDAG